MRFRCEVQRAGDPGQYKALESNFWLGGGESEQRVDEKRLTARITFGQPSHSTLPDHVHRLDSLQRPPRTLK